MSGGSMGYAYQLVLEARDRIDPTTPLRIELQALMTRVAEAVRAIEWHDSGDHSEVVEETMIYEALLPRSELL